MSIFILTEPCFSWILNFWNFLMGKLRIGIYPGSFDPLTNGHLDIIKRAAVLCDTLIVAVARNGAKKPLFSDEERLKILKECCHSIDGVEVTLFEGLLSEYCVRNGVSCIVRGLRGTVDFEYEMTMSHVNKKLSPDLETLFLAADPGLSCISSSIVKEVALLGGDISSLVPRQVIQALTSKSSFN